MFMAATTVQAYAEARSIVESCPDELDDGLLFQLKYIAANASFFASQVAEGDSKKSWLIKALADIVSIPFRTVDSVREQQLASLVHAISVAGFTELANIGHPSNPSIESGLRKMARLAKDVISPGVSFPDD